MRHEMTFRHAQRGVALIVTLIILVIVTFMGLIAMRTGLLQVAMATNSQVSVLLFQNADAGTGSVESMINADVKAANAPGGPITLIKDNPGKEVVGCLTKAGLKLAKEIDPTKKRLCDLDATAGADFVSGRGAVVVQTSLVSPLDASGNAQTVPSYGTDDSDIVGGSALVAVYATSVMPNYGSATNAEVEDCMKNLQEGATTVTSCLLDKKASFQTVVQEFVYGYPGYK